MLADSMQNVVEAQGNIGELAKQALDVLSELGGHPRLVPSVADDYINSYTADMLSIELVKSAV